MNKLLKIGHRGAKGYLAENTLESIQKAMDLGVDMVEIDVHQCATGELYVMHDFTLERTTNGQGEIAKKTAIELSELKIENKYKIPLLKEVLELLAGKCQLNIELKGDHTAKPVCRLVQEMIKNGNWKYEDILISSFQKEELIAARKFDADIPIAVLHEESIADAIELAEILKAVAIHPSAEMITREHTERMQELGFRVQIWTVNEAEEIQRIANFGVDGIISDYPDRLNGISAH